MEVTLIVMKSNLPRSLSLFLILFLSVGSSSIFSQKNEIGIDSIFKKYTDTYHENVYVHLNKTKFIKGEDIGFTAYVFHRQSKLLSNYSKNLYCLIYNQNDSIVKKKLLRLENGVAHNTFNIDENFKDGVYTFKAYTNWMLNFPDQIFTDSFEVIDGATNELIERTKRSKSLDIQFLPESGHLLQGVRNAVGVVVKDSLNYGVPNLAGEIRNQNNELISEFKLNKFGISRFSLLPKIGENYRVSIQYQDSIIQRNISEKIEPRGILLKVAEFGKHCMVSLTTNQETLKTIANKSFQLTFHDGSDLKVIPVSFGSQTVVNKKIPVAGLSTGINVFTLFDGNDKPIAERLFFNYNNLNIWKSKVSGVKRKDSMINLDLEFENYQKRDFTNLSISVLPKGTKSYQKNNNIIAQSLLKPFVKGSIEEAGYYFQKIDKKVKYDLDNLLITQGWSSYNWDTIFNYNYDKKYLFENGIAIKVAIPRQEKDRQFVIHGISTRKSQIVSLEKKDNAFSLKNYFPIDGEKLSISRINRNGNLKTTKLDLAFYPKDIPVFDHTPYALQPKAEYYALEVFADANWFKNQNKSELLDEIYIRANVEQRRREKIKRKSFGNIYFTEEMDERLTLVDFLNKKPGLRAREDYTKGEIEVVNTFQRMSGGQDAYPIFFLDDNEITRDQLFRYWMDNVDYVEIGYFNSGKNISSKSSMTISIYTKKGANRNRGKPTISKYKFPLTFSSAKKFYVPKYQDYKSAFFRDYGVVDWLPINSISEDGKANIAFTYKQNEDLVLFIEGITSKGEFVFEEKEINFKKN